MSDPVPDYAPGLPAKKEHGDLSQLKPGLMTDYVVQKHEAKRAGTHYDWRFGTPETGLFSWATKKELPKPGQMIALFQQPLHRHEYKDFHGVIEDGYGAGKVTKHDEGKILVTHISPRALHLTRSDKKFPERYVLVKPQKDGFPWLLRNVTPTEPIPYVKKHYRTAVPDDLDKVLGGLEPGSSVQPKIDGAAVLVQLLKDRAEVLSYRISKLDGRPIIHTERTLPNNQITLPKELEGTVLRGELYGVRKGKVIEPHTLGGLLNASVQKSLENQKQTGTKLKTMVFDIQQLGSKDVTQLPYLARLALTKKVLKHLPTEHFHPPEEAHTEADARKLYEQVASGKHPLTKEGIVVHRPHGVPTKVKLFDEHDVTITGFFPAEGKYAGNAVGGFTYKTKGGGTGKVGTGFSDVLRRDMHKHPELYLGRIARVQAQAVHTSGALRAPSLLALHEDYPMKKTAEAFLDALEKASMGSATKGFLIGTSLGAGIGTLGALKAKGTQQQSKREQQVRRVVSGAVGGALYGTSMGMIHGMFKAPSYSKGPTSDDAAALAKRLRGANRAKFDALAADLRLHDEAHRQHADLHKPLPIQRVHENKSPDTSPPKRGHLHLVKKSALAQAFLETLIGYRG